ncbi:hypothetical protein MANES_03G153000v8 [Manihot esculenta]|uniref:Retrotransposon gag domain-containing protein n=1 Tax=Manihot esculenta TaxID=3983 RepID=A0A2C9W9V9_MANES|nr:hypothetical protein MANES_03G153000v8 [Manihot esculenta]
MTHKSKNSLQSLPLSSNHDYKSYAHFSQSPCESNDEDEELQPPSGDRQFSVASSSSIPSLKSTSISQPNFQPSNSYVNVAPLPVFHGLPNECPFAHLSRFVKVCRANNASSTDTMVRIFPVTLENEAALWYDLNIEPYPSLSWDEIKLSFLEAYYRIETVDQLRSELLMLNQESEESVRSYFLRMQWILKRWPEHGLSDNMLKGIFIDGLMVDFRDWIIPQKPSSLNEALSLAFSFERVKIITSGTRQKFAKCCESRERMRESFRKRKEKQMMVSSEGGNESDVAAKEIGREDDYEEEEEDDNGKLQEMFSGKKTEKCQCQCSKHQCWKKKLQRNNSAVTRKSSA